MGRSRRSTSSTCATGASRPGWDRTPPGPELPDEVVDGTRSRYVEAFELLTGIDFERYLAEPEVVAVRVTVLIRPKAGILDPQGEAVQASLASLGFAVTSARIGRLVELDVDAADACERACRGRAHVRGAAGEPADRELRDRDGGCMTEDRPRIAVVTFPGSNDDGDACLALERPRAPKRCRSGTRASELPDRVGGVVLPGGFSYGDYLRCGALARVAPVMGAIRGFAADGGPVLGICNGFQILCEAGLLPGVLRANRQVEFVCADVTVTVESAATPFTSACTPGDRLVIPIKHGEGNWVADDELAAEVEARAQVVLRYDARRERVARPRRRRRER